jgi:hypothetical protein
MQNRSSNIEDRRGGEPQRIGDILAELLARYEAGFPAARITLVETPAVTEEHPCLSCPAELASVS